jgi:manganese transport protein
MLLANPYLPDVATGFIPSIPDSDALIIAIGIIGATVMPHNLYLHSALVQSRMITRTTEGIRKAIRYNIIDSAIALNLALFVNAAILILAASVFYKSGYNGVSEIQDAHKLLEPLLGKSYAPTLFAIALIASGQSSTVTGTLSGQIVMEGYLHLRIAPWLRRLITRLLAVIPALLVVHYAGEHATGEMLVMSQVILGMQLGFAVIPLLHYVSDKNRMGIFAIGTWSKVAGWTAALVIVCLNIGMVVNQIQEWTKGPGALTVYLTAVPLFAFSMVMLAYITFKPFVSRFTEIIKPRVPHGHFDGLSPIRQPRYKNIAIALDFSTADQKAIEHALYIGGTDANYMLFHAVETAGAWVLGSDISDLEADSDSVNLDKYAQAVRELGYSCEAFIGFGSAKKALPRLALEKKADILVMGAHGHHAFKDLVFGTTVGAVRHAVEIPVLIVR